MTSVRIIGIAAFTATWLELLAPVHAYPQCTSADPIHAVANPASNSSSVPQFYDEPQFTVAGVADPTNLGGHGSDALVRNKEDLAKDTSALKGSSARSSKPDDATNSIESAEALAADGKYKESRAHLQSLLAQKETADLTHELAEVEEKLQLPLEAAHHYQRAAEMNPSEPYLFDWGAELLAHRAPQAAIEVFTKGARLFPASMRMLVGLGVAWHAQGSYERAADCLCAASDLNPSEPAPYVFLVKAQNTEGSRAAAVLERLARFARLQPDNALANFYYASALWKSANGSADAATTTRVQSLLEKAIHLDSNLAPAYLLQGIVESNLGQRTKAISAYQRAAAADPHLEEPHYRLSQAYRRTGEKAKAQQELAAYQQIAKTTTAAAERERSEIQQFVVRLRDAKPGSGQPEKP